MPEQDHANGDSDKAKQGNNNPFKAASSRYKFLPVGLRRIISITFMAFLILLLASIYVPNLKERVRFFTENLLSLAILLVVAVQAYIYLRQWEVMDKQAEAAKTAAEAARNSVEEGKRNFIVQMRPYVHVGARLKTFEMDRQAEIELIFLNEGNTVAENISVKYTMSITDRPERPTGETFFQLAPFNVSPHKNIPVSVFSRILWNKPFNALSYGEAWFFCWGSGTYSGLGGPYDIQFCFVYRRETAAFGECADLEVQGKKHSDTANADPQRDVQQ